MSALKALDCYYVCTNVLFSVNSDRFLANFCTGTLFEIYFPEYQILKTIKIIIMTVRLHHPARKSFDSVVDDFFNTIPGLWNEGYSGINLAPVNIYETSEGYQLEVSVPGINKEDIKVNVEKGLLTISYDKKEETKSEEYKTVRREFSHRGFKRSFTVADQVNTEAIQAKYENGILKLFLPKKDQVKDNPKQVVVQ
jgi:HSP20 family protein